MQKRTEAEIEDLKRQWERDPIWDIEETEGFEAHREELLAWREAKEAEWEDETKRKEAEDLEKLKIASDHDTWKAIQSIKKEIDRLDRILQNFIDDGK